MPNIPNELIEKLADLQDQIWRTTSNSVSEAANMSIMFSNPLTVTARTSDLYAELAAPMMVIQFAFAALPENPQVILIPQDVITALAEAMQGTTIEEIDENIVAELRAPLEAIVQGMCLGLNIVRSEMVVASGLSIRYQIFSFPPNLQARDTVARTQIAIGGDEISGSMIWLIDHETLHYVISEPMQDEDEEPQTPFAKMGEDDGGSQRAAPRMAPAEEMTQLELLLDVPLEISVELGRVKMLVRDVLDLSNGSVLEIDKSAGEPVDVLVNGRLMAHGEVVVIEDNFGVRITEIVNPGERANRAIEAA
jgi:flagellar motor switch protein FliN/FliY